MTGQTGVLLVDDHELFAESLRVALEQTSDLAVLGRVGTLADALERIRKEPPDVVLLDYRLPDGDGVTGTERIKAIAPKTRVVIVTAVQDDAVLVAAVEAGCSGFVTKTSSLEELLTAVRSAAAGEAVISPALLARLLPRLHRSYRGVGSDLTARELEVLHLLAEGLTNAAIAERLTLSVYTVRNHVQNVLSKLQVHSKLEALSVAVREGLLPPSGVTD